MWVCILRLHTFKDIDTTHAYAQMKTHVHCDNEFIHTLTPICTYRYITVQHITLHYITFTTTIAFAFTSTCPFTFTLHYTSLQYITLHYITGHDITWHDMTLHCITLHYIHTHTHTYTPTHIHTYIRTYIRTYVHTYIRTSSTICIIKKRCLHTHLPWKLTNEPTWWHKQPVDCR